MSPETLSDLAVSYAELTVAEPTEIAARFALLEYTVALELLRTVRSHIEQYVLPQFQRAGLNLRVSSEVGTCLWFDVPGGSDAMVIDVIVSGHFGNRLDLSESEAHVEPLPKVPRTE